MRTASVVVFFTVLAWSQVAAADPPADSEAAFEASMKAGNAALAAARYAEARDEFEAAYAVSGDPTALFYVGLSQLRGGEFDAAQHSYSRFLDEAATDHPLRELAEKNIATLERVILQRMVRAQDTTQVAPPEGGRSSEQTLIDRGEPERRAASRWVRFRFGAGLELASRTFRYSRPQTSSLRSYEAWALPMVRLSSDWYPLAGHDAGKAEGLSISGQVSVGAPLTSSSGDGMPIDTRHGDMALGIGWGWPVGERWDVDSSLSYGRQYFSFDETSALFDETPDVDYRYWRLGMGGALVLRPGFHAFGTVHYDRVTSVGTLVERFGALSVYGVGARLGLAASLIPSFGLELAGSLNRYSLTFHSDEAASMADGASDQFLGVMASAVYSH